jgi:catechol 2,3-dioxygenase-like lactoylglutathione lyase family enzyme
MNKPDTSGIAPFFIVRSVPAALSFYRDRLGFDITFQGPDPDDIFFGVVQRGAAMIMFKDVGVDPVPNYARRQERDRSLGRVPPRPGSGCLSDRILVARCRVFRPAQRHNDGLRGFELKDADGYVLFFGRPR